MHNRPGDRREPAPDHRRGPGHPGVQAGGRGEWRDGGQPTDGRPGRQADRRGQWPDERYQGAQADRRGQWPNGGHPGAQADPRAQWPGGGHPGTHADPRAQWPGGGHPGTQADPHRQWPDGGHRTDGRPGRQADRGGQWPDGRYPGAQAGGQRHWPNGGHPGAQADPRGQWPDGGHPGTQPDERTDGGIPRQRTGGRRRSAEPPEEPNRRGHTRRGVLTAALVTLAGGGLVGGGAIWRLSGSGDGSGSSPASAVSAKPTPSPTPDYLGPARKRVEAYVRATKGRIAVAVQDRVTGVSVTVGTQRFQTASIVKADILAAVLWHAQQDGKKVSSADRERARKSITLSDNDATSALYDRIDGKPGLTAANRAFGLKETAPNVRWGMTLTTVADQIRLLTALSTEDGPLTEADRTYLFGLMSKVDEEQDWGITAAAGTDTTESYVKNGWDQLDADNGKWAVNSIGRLVEPEHDWLIAVLSSQHTKMETGIRMVEKVAKYAVGELRKIPLPS
ncbi:serine hydrolase [Micromonospora musae]|uniref:serine hydrolase n=1 Tax=Micromonospora musae TaxID=1894970 RepID=UPI00341533FB